MIYRHLPEPPEEVTALLMLIAGHVFAITDEGNPFGPEENLAVALNLTRHKKVLGFVRGSTFEALQAACPKDIEWDMRGMGGK